MRAESFKEKRREDQTQYIYNFQKFWVKFTLQSEKTRGRQGSSGPKQYSANASPRILKNI
ncbi:hypothetical protein HanPSC8_Chr13g0559381 [Helianthus annuus]|nr:hypothetical protein HanPSC8_Chr13g0559381 [Helianthus annuus]